MKEKISWLTSHTISTTSESEFNDVIALLELLDLKQYDGASDYPYEITPFILLNCSNMTYQPSCIDTTIPEWRITAKEFIDKYF